MRFPAFFLQLALMMFLCQALSEQDSIEQIFLLKKSISHLHVAQFSLKRFEVSAGSLADSIAEGAKLENSKIHLKRAILLLNEVFLIEKNGIEGEIRKVGLGILSMEKDIEEGSLEKVASQQKHAVSLLGKIATRVKEILKEFQNKPFD